VLWVEGVGERLRRARKAAGLPAKAAARDLGISAAYLSQIEHGVRSGMSTSLVARAAELYGVSADYLVGVRTPPMFELFAKLQKHGFLTAEHYHAFWMQICSYCVDMGFDPVRYLGDLGVDLSPPHPWLPVAVRSIDQMVPTDVAVLDYVNRMKRRTSGSDCVDDATQAGGI